MIKTYKYLTSKIFRIFNFFFKSVLFESYISNYEEFLVLKIPYMSKKAISYIDNLILEKNIKIVLNGVLGVRLCGLKKNYLK